MLLFYAMVVCALFAGSSSFSTVTECYGKSLIFPFYLSPPVLSGQLYFSPRTGGPPLLLVDNGVPKHPRVKLQRTSLQLIHLTEKDAGFFSTSNNNGHQRKRLELKILTCADPVTKDYGDIYSTEVPREAEFLEFTPLRDGDQLKVVWNRSDPQANNGGRGQIDRNFYKIRNLNQADMGYYNFRGKDNALLSRIELKVEALRRYYTRVANKEVLIEHPQNLPLWTVAFTPSGAMRNQTLMRDGRLLTEEESDSDSAGLALRLRAASGGLLISPLEITDSGTFTFRDQHGHLVLTARVTVEPAPFPTLALVGVIAGILFALIFCCCCVRKCCCRKNSRKRAELAPQATVPPAVYLHDTYQPEVPSYCAAPAVDPTALYSKNSLVSSEHAAVALEPLVAPAGGLGVDAAPSLRSDFLSSDTEATFQLKGLHYAAPLSSSSTFADVYTSDKLNFL